MLGAHEPPLLPPHAGYTSQHSCYSQECQWWARWSFTSPPAETITLKISAHYEANICEGKKDIDATISAQDLVMVALKTIVPKVKTFCPTFPWWFNEFVVHDTDWVDLSAHHSPLPYFYPECLQPACKNPNSVVFKSKQFQLYVVVPAAQWHEYEVFFENAAATSSDTDPPDSDVSCDSRVNGVMTTSSMALTSNISTLPFHLCHAQSMFMPTHMAISPTCANEGESTRMLQMLGH
ncbi:hypothetical protein M404DRAFT_132723 [Pisolithus tinctorius Marx 270]|uniref:Uncharacterized protein n=1 Tax=Pisolithus tinctorius Marx 270 TaxID=870435 RepID=A0A0C3P707_PISTI|nr:hypothetical protein M404DRAFT_132723 [Pisolithus tinctorius Marx 270]